MNGDMKVINKIIDMLQAENNKSRELILKYLESEDECYYNQHLKHVYATEVLLELLGLDIDSIFKKEKDVT